MLNKHFILIVLFICFVLSGLVGNYYSNNINSQSKNDETLQSTKPYEAQQVSQSTDIVYGIYYLSCNHLIKGTPDASIIGQNIDSLVKKYPPEDGWVVDNLNPKHILIYKKQTGLCPNDIGKRHLGIQGEYVAVYRGPVGINAGIERVTEIKVQQLPQEFREKVKLGLLDFANENELMEALDTIDEFQQ